MEVKIWFYSYYKDLAACTGTAETLPEGSTLDDLKRRLAERFPKLGVMQKSTLVAVGVDYQKGDYVLQAGDEVSLFPPVQGG